MRDLQKRGIVGKFSVNVYEDIIVFTSNTSYSTPASSVVDPDLSGSVFN